MTTAMVLAAGFGERLRPLTDRLPKALVPIGDRPIIEHTFENIIAQLGPTNFVVNAHYKANELQLHLSTVNQKVKVLCETEILGTAGGLRAALPYLGKGAVVVTNADILASPNYRHLLTAAENHSSALCVSARPVGCGTLGVNEHGNIVRMRGQVFGSEVVGADYIGIAAFGICAIESFPSRGCIIGDWALPKLRRSEMIRVVFSDVHWTDIGEIGTYAEANWRWLQARGLKHWVCPTATVHQEARLDEVVVGGGASIDCSGQLRRVVVWPGARVRQPVVNCVVLDNGDVIAI